MTGVVAQMGALILCGLLWQWLQPHGLAPRITRQVLTTTVYYLFLPALVLNVLWRAELGIHSLGIGLTAAVTVISGMAIGWLLCRICRASPPVTGATLLAAAFPNSTYMGLPALESLFGEQGTSIAIQYDLFGCTPLVFTLGVLVAWHYGEGRERPHVLRALLTVPPLWAGLAAVGLNLAGIPQGDWLNTWLGMLGSAVVPLMLFSLGLSLPTERWHRTAARPLAGILAIQLLLAPAIAWWLASRFGLEGTELVGTVLEAAMPSMVLGIVFCDRYGLDSSLYAVAVTLTTALSFFTLPLVHGLLT